MRLHGLPAWLRWIAVAPAAFVAGCIAKLLTNLNPFIYGPSILKVFAAEMLGAAAIVVVGAHVAPKHHSRVAKLLSGVIVLITLFSLAITPIMGITANEFASDLGGMAGAVIGVTFCYDRERDTSISKDERGQ
jgi:hypothetical protein